MRSGRDVSYDDALSRALTDRQEAAAYLTAVIVLNDSAALRLALGQVAKANGVGDIALSSSARPTMDEACRVLAAIGLQFKVDALPA